MLYNWVGTSGFELKIENERLTVICSRSRQNLKCGSQATRCFGEYRKEMFKMRAARAARLFFFFLTGGGWGVALNYRTIAMDPFK